MFLHSQISASICIKMQSKPNGIAQHVHNNKKHSIDWDNQIFLDFESHWRKKNIQEALFIDSINPGADIMPNTLMNILNLKEGH